MSAFIASERLLSSVLEGLSDPAILIEPNRRILASNQSFRIRFNAGRDPRGSYCYEMTHGRCSRCDPGEAPGCPLEARGVSSAIHRHTHCVGEVDEEVFAHPVEGRGGTVSAYLLVTHPLSCRVQLVGRSRPLTRMMALVDHAANEDVPVLLRGEAGAGRLCVARMLHRLSARATGPFVVANCGTARESVLAEEFFGGYGVDGPRRRGLIESADKGTLMLQAVDDLPAGLAPKLVDTIIRGAFTLNGNGDERHVDVRWVLACRGNSEFVAARAFPGLIRIAVPALRLRLQDLPILVETMIDKYGDGSVRGISDEAMTLLRRHSYPGNVRELESLIERACLLAGDGLLECEHFPDLAGRLH